jgi:hypothetical protein
MAPNRRDGLVSSQTRICSGAHHRAQRVFFPALLTNPSLSALSDECCNDVQGDQPQQWRRIDVMDLFHPKQEPPSAEDFSQLSVKALSQDTLSSLGSCLVDV